ncbi:MAG: ectonucleotide pyrophosphatase/phosphodiesterase [Bacteroidetes bacterium]|nr:ectonucleotide pyrophosphatase/phosphodiesterase [Bacteroidota bacterium]
MRRFIFLTVSMLFAIVLPAQDTSQQVVAGRLNAIAQRSKPYVILISADGFRYDFATKYNAVNLQRLAKQGVQAEYMQPSFPSLTFPNHYSIVTGLYPAHHGLVDNSFYDRQRQVLYSMSDRKMVQDAYWYGGEPLWVLAEKQQLLSASYYWVGSEAREEGIAPSYFYYYSDKVLIEQRLAVVKQWLQLPEEKRPHLICFYFPQVDHAAHLFGPESPETAEAVRWVDEAVGNMTRLTDSLGLPVNYVFVSDHGMVKVNNEKAMGLPAALDTNRYIVSRGDAILQLYAKDGHGIRKQFRKLRRTQDGYTTYLKKQLPAHWHYGVKDDRYQRIGDIVLIPTYPKIFGAFSKKITPGKHGYDPLMPEMRASFLAWGPGVANAGLVPAFENIHVYPFVAGLLGLSYDPATIDGKGTVLSKYLRLNSQP